MARLLTGALIGIVLIAPVISLIYLEHLLFGHHYVPVEWVHSTWGLIATETLLGSEAIFITGPYFTWGILVSSVAYVRLSRDLSPATWRQGLMVGLIFGMPMILLAYLLTSTWTQTLISIFVLVLQFGLWGLAYAYIYNYVKPTAEEQESSPSPPRPLAPHPEALRGTFTRPLAPSPLRLQGASRRRFLLGLGAVATLLTMPSSGISTLLHRTRQNLLAARMKTPLTFPDRLTAQVYRVHDSFEFPEQAFARYQPQNHPIGVCFSGGGPRSMSASMGQMRGLVALGLLDSIGAISCVSGGGWFSTIFTYAPTDIDDATLLGPMMAPEALTLENLSQLNSLQIAAPITDMTDENMLLVAREVMRSITLSQTTAFNRFYSRLLNEMMLKRFGLHDYHKLFTLDEAAVNRILARNPSLKAEQFYTARPNRPYLICGATHIHPPGPEQVLRQFEITPLYAGMPRFFPNAGHEETDLGGGYIESFAFDSEAPLERSSNDVVTVPTPEPLFLLSDMIGSTSAAPGVMLAHYRDPSLMPQFKMWPFTTLESTSLYSIVDGDALENLGIVPLLRRQYPIILCFVNVFFPLDSDTPLMVDGIHHQISRLFGFLPENTSFNPQSTHIFPAEQFEPLANALKSARQNGELTAFVDSYQIVQPNPLDIPSYPNNGKVTVVWFYNDMNERWYNKLSPEVQELLKSNEPTNRMDNFPHFTTVDQNMNPGGIPNLLSYTPQQVNLLSHLWAYNVAEEAGEMLKELRDSVG